MSASYSFVLQPLHISSVLSFSFSRLTFCLCLVLCLICMQPSSAAPGICQLSYDQVTAATALAFVFRLLVCPLFALSAPHPEAASFLSSTAVVLSVHFIKCVCTLVGFLTEQLELLPTCAHTDFCVVCAVTRWRMSGMQNYNPEQIVLSAVARRSSRDVNIMKEKLIFSGASLTTFTLNWSYNQTEQACAISRCRCMFGDLNSHILPTFRHYYST